MTRALADAIRWTREGTKLVLDAVAELDEAAFAGPSALPGWTRGHLIAHLAANAEALRNLVGWAATGVEKPMYASPEERAEGIAQGATLSADRLGLWLDHAADALDVGMSELSASDWEREIRTAQGRTVPASEIPWLRAREVMVHAVDLDHGIGFADLPDDFLEALVADILRKRGDVTVPHAPLADVAAWLSGRPHGIAGVPELGPWL
ncbi:maleylpyruvate isomerase family mycothiol-dependent enzyme [Sphaerimonospora sp. CA-214678]|uniref:maleylpyruvate isomerase family mycothiol-dependent enzyme n=1 Tax=Sphaerimonospora sp. CA-214678 TaxID=3240029 RepID=UPI003D8C288C